MKEGRVYYNEWDKPTAAWLGELGATGELPAGHVDTRSIRDVQPDDLDGYDQCHFFAGIGGWPLALRWADLENVPGIWTGSPPCQPFSVAGKGLAQSDERHLAPVWLDLIKECRPQLIFGEQVEAAIRTGWLDDLFDALEGCGYACGAAVLPACGVGAPHIRKRLFFGAVRLDDAASARHVRALPEPEGQTRDGARVCMPSDGRTENRLADTHQDGREPGREVRPICAEYDAEHGGAESGLANTNNTRPQGRTGMSERADEQPLRSGSLESRSTNSHHGGWSDADWLGCRDGKFRPVEPQIFGVVNGVSDGVVQGGIVSASSPLAQKQEARVMRLRGYGNAIVPQAATIFIQEFMNSISDITE